MFGITLNEMRAYGDAAKLALTTADIDGMRRFSLRLLREFGYPETADAMRKILDAVEPAQ